MYYIVKNYLSLVINSLIINKYRQMYAKYRNVYKERNARRRNKEQGTRNVAWKRVRTNQLKALPRIKRSILEG